MDIYEFGARGPMMQALADEITQQLRAILSRQSRASIAVPGGSTPAPFLSALASYQLNWADVSIIPSDERMVPDDHPRSNAQMILTALGADLASAVHFMPLYDATADKILDAPLEAILPLDLGVFGMGADMHFASLFGDSDELGAALAGPSSLAMLTSASQSEPRITLTGPVILQIKRRYILIQGEEKMAALRRAQEINDPMLSPVSLIFDEHTAVYYAP